MMQSANIREISLQPFCIFMILGLKLQNIKMDFMSLRKVVKELVTQVVFSSILPVGDADPRRRR